MDYKKEKFKNRCYELYQLDWMMSHGYSLQNLFNILREGYIEGWQSENIKCDEDFDEVLEFFEEQGFRGELYVCKQEFYQAEFLDKEYMLTLLSRFPNAYEEYLEILSEETPERFQDIQFDDFQVDDLEKGEGNYVVSVTDELIDIVNEMRLEKGYQDIVSVDIENDVYYNFYLSFNKSERKIEMMATVNHSEKDDYGVYYIPLTKKEEESLLWKIVAQMPVDFLER